MIKLKTKLPVALITCFISATGLGAESHQLEREMRNLQIDHRMDQIRQELKAVSDATISGSTDRNFTSSPPVYRIAPRLIANDSSMNISAERLEEYLERLGDPEKKTGIYAYPPEERLYHYGKMCLDVGLVAEGIKAISEHTRIQAEQATRDHQNEPISSAMHQEHGEIK